MTTMLLDRVVAKLFAAPGHVRKRKLARHVRLVRRGIHLPPPRPKWTPPDDHAWFEFQAIIFAGLCWCRPQS
jgi:hypothetical protein